ncbi:ABC-type Fe2+-enterobactin transport system, periplasmic component [Hahella chejuensis KCTC 2396]|uniref:ABC-type Fe2+-enterobactin transport system, periplasmic component n=1 Tax=Hahella chejuensis (strain KCTC 2396) TaxID=349521 RepID=Q2SFQ2_HAHCH|nr:Fe2+-enterobactin ABC transporter substrate-binding protein [Hahella chejuensis]ABC30522.1 ABC-type Fe2+-enterobactin transport system, periplasmic component [Hahella chejuensis KCTC 2396]
MLRNRFLLLLISFCACLLIACSGDRDGPPDASAQSSPSLTIQNASTWPRTLVTSQGELTLEQAPQRIVSTSVTLTGVLLAIDAPVVASGASSANTEVADEQGFFRQWGDVARQRGVRPIYQGAPDAEAIIAEQPDLIVMARTGGDSALALYEQLSLFAPVLVLNYDDKSWQELASALGAATGREQQAQAVIEEFNAQVASVKTRLQLPPQPVSALVYYEDGSGANLWTPDSAQGQLLQALGFEIATPPSHVQGGTLQGERKDIVQLAGENLSDGLQGRTMLLFSADESSVRRINQDKFLAHTPAILSNRVYAVGLDTFRLDYYSASNLLQRLASLFPETPTAVADANSSFMNRP